MNLEWYYTFIVLAKYLNYRKASEELFITQPSIFQQIKRLEQHLHLKLFEKMGKGIQLTESGKHVLLIAKKLVSTYEEGMEKINKKNQKYSIHLNVVVCSYIATYIIPKFLPILFEREPSMEVSIIVKDSNIIEAIETNTFDIGILREKPYSSKINCKKVCEGKIKLIVPNVPETSEINDELFYLNNYRILSNNHPIYWTETSDKILSLIPEADLISIESVKVSEQLIKANQGVSYLPVYILNDDIGQQLKAIEPKLIPSPISFTYLVNIKKSAEIDRFNSLFEEFILKEQLHNHFPIALS